MAIRSLSSSRAVGRATHLVALKLVAKMIPVDPTDPSAGVHTLNSLLESMKEEE